MSNMTHTGAESPTGAPILEAAAAVLANDPSIAVSNDLRPLQAYDVATFVHRVNYFGPTTEVQAYVDAFTLVALFQGQEVVRITFRPSEAIKIVRRRSGEPLTPHRLAGAMRAVESWKMREEQVFVAFDRDYLSKYIDWMSEPTNMFVAVRRPNKESGDTPVLVAKMKTDWVETYDEAGEVEDELLPRHETAQIHFFDKRQYHGYSELDFRFSYEARNGKVKTTYRLPRFRAQRDEAFADVVGDVAEQTGTKPLMLVSPREVVEGVDLMIDAYNAAQAARAGIDRFDFSQMSDGERAVVFEDGPIYSSGSLPTSIGWSSVAYRVVVVCDEGAYRVEIQQSEESDPWNWRPTDLGESKVDYDRTYVQEAFPEGVKAVATAFAHRAKAECEMQRSRSAEEAAKYGITERQLVDQWDAAASRLNAEEDRQKEAA